MEDLFDDEIKEALKHFCKNCSKCEGKFLTSIWDKMPDGCGLEGWLFQKREIEKQKIRRKKEIKSGVSAYGNDLCRLGIRTQKSRVRAFHTALYQ